MRGAIGLLKMVLSQPQLIPGSGLRLSSMLHEMLKRVQGGKPGFGEANRARHEKWSP